MYRLANFCPMLTAKYKTDHSALTHKLFPHFVPLRFIDQNKVFNLDDLAF